MFSYLSSGGERSWNGSLVIGLSGIRHATDMTLDACAWGKRERRSKWSIINEI